jgi:predicted GH43/DUF377 family glycosyl hydrolase
MAILHRPLFPGTRPEETACHPTSRAINLHRESIWISYCSTKMDDCEPHHLCHFGSHHRLATPVEPWERLKIGGGTPPVLTRHGWLVVYHGVGETAEPTKEGRKLCYSAGVMVLSKAHPRAICYRSRHPILTPDVPLERRGIVANVVFPTGIDRRDDLGASDRFDIYYGMADDRMGLRAWTCRIFFRQEDSPTRRERRYRVTICKPNARRIGRAKSTPASAWLSRRSWKVRSLC